MNTIQWYIRELRSELILVVLALLSFLVAPSVQAQSLHQLCPTPIPTANPTVPQGVAADDTAFFPAEIIEPEYQPAQKMTDNGFNYLVGMMNAVTVYPCDRGKEAKVEFKSIRLIHKDPNTGYETVEQLVTFGNGWQKPNGIFYAAWNREPYWFTSGLPAIQPTNLASIAKQTYTVDLRSVPKGIFHAWTNPRLPAVPGHAYFVEVVVRVTGDARLQLGMDYWRGSASDYTGWTPGCVDSNNCQAWLSNWLGDTRGKFVTWRAPSLLF